MHNELIIEMTNPRPGHRQNGEGQDSEDAEKLPHADSAHRWFVEIGERVRPPVMTEQGQNWFQEFHVIEVPTDRKIAIRHSRKARLEAPERFSFEKLVEDGNVDISQEDERSDEDGDVDHQPSLLVKFLGLLNGGIDLKRDV